MGALSRNAEVLKYFSEKAQGLGVTHLQKLAYLADLEARKLLGRPISEFEYIWHHHGPFDKALYHARDELAAKGFVERDERYTIYGSVEKRTFDTGKSAEYSFSPAEREILDYVARTYVPAGLSDVLAHVYQTEPMKQAVRGRRVPVEVLDNRDRAAIGFDLEEVLAAERDLDNGRYTLATDFFNGLRAQISSGRPVANH